MLFSSNSLQPSGHLTAADVDDTLAALAQAGTQTDTDQNARVRSEIEAALLALPIEIAVLDRDGSIVAVNEAWTRFARENGALAVAENSIGVSYLQVCRQAAGLSAREAQQVCSGVQAVLDGARPSFTLEYPCHSPARQRWFLLHVAPLLGSQGAVVSHFDITERKHAEKGRTRMLARELAERASQIRAIFDTMQDGITLTDRQGRILLSNPAYQRLFALDRDPEHAARLPKERATLLGLSDPSSGRPLNANELPIVRALHGEVLGGATAMDLHACALDGRELDLNVSAAPLRNSERQVIGALSVYRDVTERWRLEQERAGILRNVVHELGNPLGAVNLYVQTQLRQLQKGTLPPVPDPVLLETMEHSLERVIRLVDDLHLAAGIERGRLDLELARCDLVVLCRQEMEAQRLATGRNLRLVVPGQPVLVMADRDRLGQVIGNLLSNAHKYSPADRPITLTLRVIGQGTHARVTVQDKGPGIPSRELPHIWERFHRVKDIKVQCGPALSLGLGLYISKRIIDQHGGRIAAASAVGKGSTFSFTLALADAATLGATG